MGEENPPREIRNAIARSVEIGCEDHGLLTIWVRLDYGNSTQGFGGYALGSYSEPVMSPHCGEWIRKLLRLFEVDEVSKIAGKPCRADCRDGLIKRLGHWSRDEWFDPQEIRARQC